MKQCCLKSRKSTESKNQKVVKTKSRRRRMLSLNCAFPGSKNSRFIKGQEVSGL